MRLLSLSHRQTATSSEELMLPAATPDMRSKRETTCLMPHSELDVLGFAVLEAWVKNLRSQVLRGLAIGCVLVAFLSPRLEAQVESAPLGVAVKIYARGQGAGGSVSLSGTFLESAPGAADGYASQSGSAGGAPNYYALAVLGTGSYVRVEPGKSYIVSVAGSVSTNRELNVMAPPGYRVVMDNLERTRQPYSGTTNIVVQIQKAGGRHPGLAGMASSVAANEVEWKLSLGALLNGSSAGELALVDTGTRSDWAPLFTPAMLNYEATSAEVSVYRPSNILRQIIANQVVVDIVTLTSNSYVIRCYHPSQLQGGSFPYTFNGQPYASYTIEQGATSTTIKFTKEIRNTSASDLTAAVSRKEVMTLARTGSWPTFAWTRRDWTLDGHSPLTEIIAQSSGTTANRAEAITVRSVGMNAVSLKLNRSYTALANIGEALTGESVGTNTNLTAAIAYYNDPLDFGSLGRVKSIILPGGIWTAFDYYQTSLPEGFRGGRVKTIYRPFVDTPSVVSTQPGSGEVVYHEYVDDVFGAPLRPSLVETKVNGTLTAKTTTAYNDSAGSANGHALTQITRAEYSSATQNLQTIVKKYRDDVTDAFIRGRAYSTTGPDGVKQAFVYQRGTWNGTSFSVGSGALGTGSASRVSTITGSSNAAAGAACPNVDSYTVDTPYLVDGKSTMDVTIRDASALVVRTESHVRKSGSWQLVSFTNFTYDYAGRLTQRVGRNGATYSATYAGDLKSTETDEAGVVTSFAYDVMGRLQTSTRQGHGGIASLVARYTYNASGQVQEQQVGSGSIEHRLTSGWSYDDAGRPIQERPPGNYGVVSHSYDAAARTHTLSRADGSTVVTVLHRDGRPLSTTGTGVVATYYAYGIESNGVTTGQRWHKVSTASSSSLRWKKAWTDWLGRTVKTEAPGFTGQPNVVTESVYDQLTWPTAVSVPGRLLKTTTTGYAPTLQSYNFLGQLVRTGLDYDNNGRLDLASNDRVTDIESYLESYQGAWWLRSDTKRYLKFGSAAPSITTSRKRVSDFETNTISQAQEIDLEGNLTTSAVNVDRTNRVARLIVSRSGIAGLQVESSLNGLPTSVTSFDGLTTTTEYNALLQVRSVVDSRGNRTLTDYVPGTRLVQSITNQAGNQTVRTYDALGRVSTTRDAKNFYTRVSYTTRGELHRQWGDGAMPVEYGYNSYGERTTMSTYRAGSSWDGTIWPASPGTADTTTWSFHEPTGLLATKTDALGRAVTQTYNLRGQTASRTLARGVATTYGYDDATGDLLSQDYSDSTPDVTYTRGRAGLMESVTDVTGTRDFIYDALKPWRLSAEAHDNTTNSFYGGRVFSRLYDEEDVIGRSRGFQLGVLTAPNAELEQTYGYTDVGRFETLTAKREANGTARTFRYTYLPNSTLLQSLVIDQGGGPGGHPFTVTRTYEAQRDIVTGVESKWGGTTRTKYAYQTDERGQRSSSVQSGDVFADFGGADNGATVRRFTYNGRGEVTGDVSYLGDDAGDESQPLHGRRHEFAYDNAGNRNWSNRTGVSDLRNDYATNALNQYTSRENNTVAVSGTAAPDAGGAGGTAVAIEGRTVAAGRQGRYWNDEVVVSNSVAPWRGPLTIYAAKRGTGGSPDAFRTDIRMAHIAAASETFTYDLDGNLTGDGISDYGWDAENRLIRIETNSVARAAGFPHRLIEFKYDYMGRRVQKKVNDAGPNPDVEISCRRFLYDGWNLVAEYSVAAGTSALTIVRSYTWGLDVTRTLSDAGGVGALLQIAAWASNSLYRVNVACPSSRPMVRAWE